MGEEYDTTREGKTRLHTTISSSREHRASQKTARRQKQKEKFGKLGWGGRSEGEMRKKTKLKHSSCGGEKSGDRGETKRAIDGNVRKVADGKKKYRSADRAGTAQGRWGREG